MPAALPDPQLFGPRIDARVAHHARSPMTTCANGTLVCGHSATMACDAPTNVPLAQHPQSSRATTREPRIMRADSQCNHRAAIERETRILARSPSPPSSSSQPHVIMCTSSRAPTREMRHMRTADYPTARTNTRAATNRARRKSVVFIAATSVCFFPQHRQK